MNKPLLIKPTPWDTKAFGMPTWELLEHSTAALQQAVKTKGHHTIKIDPLEDKRLLHEHGFYYCDTLIEPYCNAPRLRSEHHSDATISKDVQARQVLEICHGAFSYGRFHRDFNLPKAAADYRYDKWLEQLLESKNVYGLYWQGVLAGFIGYRENTLVLHALSERYRGNNLSKYWWSAVCRKLLLNRYDEVKSSISVTNIAVFKLYASLGFSFKNPKDIYHCLVR